MTSIGAILQEKASLTVSSCPLGGNAVLGKGLEYVCGPACLWTYRSAHVPVQCESMLACSSADPLETALTSPETLIAPADWPNSVTLSGSPPKVSMFSCTHRRAAIWSSSPQFPRAWLLPVLGTGRFMVRVPNFDGEDSESCQFAQPKSVLDSIYRLRWYPAHAGSFHIVRPSSLGPTHRPRPLQSVPAFCSWDW